MSFAFASESVAWPKLEPRGMITRAAAPCGVLPHATRITVPARSAGRRSIRNIEDPLEQNRRGQRVNVALPTACGFAEFFDCTQCCRRGESFIIKTNRHGTTFRDFGTQGPDFCRPIGLVALSVERKAQNESPRP